VSVPRDYAAPDSGAFKLAVVVVKSAQDAALPDPVVYISGGPGAPLTIYAAHEARTPYAPRRDLVLVDQRGTGRSEPRVCPDRERALLEANMAIAAAVGTTGFDDAAGKRRAAYSSCRDSAVARGLSLRDFGTTVTVSDFESVRQALGIERWNVYGESYGTTVAMTLAALHPASIRSLVLDSVYPPDPGPLLSENVADARDSLFTACARDGGCSHAFPDLAATYRGTLDQLDRNPLIVTVPPQLHGPEHRVRLTGSLFEALVGNLIYYPTAYGGLPRLIEAVHDGRSQDLAAAFASVYATAAALDRGAYVAVECRDRPRYRGSLPADASVLDVMLLYGICDGWSDLGPPPLVPRGTHVPTLVLAGQFDPNARPTSSRRLAEEIGASARWIEFPRLGHNVRAFSPCAARIAAAFIDEPSQALDASCAERRPPIAFAPARQAP
jgi:pimeloyl-ACP methyl ester carboxylesterase